MRKNKILVLIPVWGRQLITSFCMDVMRQSIHAAASVGIELIPFYIVSEQWAEDEADRHGFLHTWQPNEPLGAKLNAGLFEARHLRYHYLMNLGSDDIIRPEYFAYIRAAIEERTRFFGVNRFYLYDVDKKECKLHDSGPIVIGAGRCIDRAIVERMSWKLWTDSKERGLDIDSERNIEQAARVSVEQIWCKHPCILDIKSSNNLNRFEDVDGVSVDIRRVYNLFPSLSGVWALPLWRRSRTEYNSGIGGYYISID